ncbi:MAG TPA: NAD(P)/FAD-dependent oxidoreductase [Anaeromyxobacteraceae bacterium]|nr:NAD(P)/FAD-dependent oxidoreductase [Anaeromyxobacteraceae bacterium]
MIDAVVVGSGPNGLAAAAALTRAGWKVRVREASDTVGGGARTLPLTLPGFLHDHCSAVHPLALASPFFSELPLEAHGLRFLQPPVACAHPFDDGTAALLCPSLGDTGATLGPDGAAWARLYAPLVRDFAALAGEVLGPVLHLPRHPLVLARFGARALLPARRLAERCFRGPRAQALFGGIAAHALQPLERPPTSAFGLLLGASAHAVGWPIPSGGAQAITDALASFVARSGGEVLAGARVGSLDELRGVRAALLDVGPRQLLALAGARLPRGYRQALERFRYGPGAFKIDYALSAPIPWRAKECARAGTVHLGGTLAEIAAAEREAAAGRMPARPFVLVSQPSAFDPSRAPPGRHVAWAYCHVPHGFAGDATGALEAQLERFAPGFREVVLARAVRAPAELERDDVNLVGGDIGGGAASLRQLLFRPAVRLDPWSTPIPGLYLCSASTPPGAGVHGMCGYLAARAALRRAARGVRFEWPFVTRPPQAPP